MIKMYVTNDETNETMECIFTDEKITYDLNGKILEVTSPLIIEHMTDSIIKTLYRNIRAHELATAVADGEISLSEMIDIVNKDFYGEDKDTEFDDNIIILSSHITQ